MADKSLFIAACPVTTLLL
jgi:hypothetical protein